MSDSTAINSRESFTVSNVKKICERLVPLLTSLKRFESSFGKIGVAGSSDAAKQLLAVSEGHAIARSLPPQGDLLTGIDQDIRGCTD